MKWFCVIFVVTIGLINLVTSIRGAWKLSRRRVISCPGRIVSSSLSSEAGLGRTASLTFYEPEIHYDYEVAGLKRTGARYSMVIRKSSHRKDFDKLLRKFPPGENVTVFYDEADPGDSYLVNPRSLIGVYLGTGEGIFLLSLALASLFWILVDG